jgi:hypothetical protein
VESVITPGQGSLCNNALINGSNLFRQLHVSHISASNSLWRARLMAVAVSSIPI